MSKYRFDDDNMVQADDFLDQKGNSGVVHIVVIILIIGLLAVGSYFLYTEVVLPKIEEADRIAEEEKKEEEEDERSTFKTIDVDSEKIINLMSYIDKGFLNREKLEVTDIENQTLFVKAIPFAIKEYKESDLTEEQFDRIIDKLYGTVYPFKHERYTAKLCVKYQYDEESNTYLYQKELFCGGAKAIPFGEDLIKAVRATEEEGIITIMARVLFFKALEVEDGVYKAKYYSDYDMTEEVTNLNISGEYDLASNTTNNLSKGALYKLTFTMDNGNYVFTSSELVNE